MKNENKELRKEIIEKIVLSLLNNINYDTDKIFCNKHAIEKATSIESTIYQHSTVYDAYINPDVIKYLTSTILSKTKEFKLII